MIIQQLYLEKYNWNLTILYNANEDLSAVAEELWYIQCPSNIALHILRKVIVKDNTGICYSNFLLKSTLICISKTNSSEEFGNTLVHELKHLQSHICSYYRISEKGEEAAYLIGDVFGELYKMLKYELHRQNKTTDRISSKS